MVLALQTGSNYARYYAMAGDNIDFSAYIDMDKSFMEDSRIDWAEKRDYEGNLLNFIPVHEYSLSREDDAFDFFKFATEHTSVEWGLIRTFSKSYIYTSHQARKLHGGGQYFVDGMLYHMHNHRISDRPSEADRKVAEQYSKIQFYLYLNNPLLISDFVRIKRYCIDK